MICSAYTILWQLIISCIGLKCTLFVQPSFEALFLLPSFGSRSNSCRSGLGLFQVISAAVLFSALSSSPRLTCSQVSSRRGVRVIEELVSSPGRRVRGRDCFPCFPSRTFSHRLQSHCRGCPPSICPHFGGWGVVLAFPFLPPTLFQVVKPFHCSSTQKHTYFKHEKGGIKGPFALGMSDPLMDQLNGRPID